MNKFQVILRLLSVLNFALADQSCRNFYSQPGVCVSLASCPSLTQLKSNPNKSYWDQIILDGSYCAGYRNADKVCCADASVKLPTSVTTPVRQTRPPSSRPPTFNIRGSFSSLLPTPGSGECGLHTVDKIFGGNKTAINEHPWLALLEYTWRKYLYF